jgi:hypothetical protein
MNYATDIATQRLSSRSWRIRHSAWLLAPILGFGIFSFVGFLYCAVRVRNQKWWRVAAITGGLSAVLWALSFGWTDDKGQTSDGAATLTIFLWIGFVIWGAILNRDYLRWRAGQTGANAWYNQQQGEAVGGARSAPVTAPAPTTWSAPAPQTVAGVDTSNYYASPPVSPERQVQPDAPTQRPDINAATPTELVAALGVDQGLANKVVAARDANGGFNTVDDLTAIAGLQPHELVRFRERVVVGPRKQAPPSGGRILDY